jgi:hypothetical protein
LRLPSAPSGAARLSSNTTTVTNYYKRLRPGYTYDKSRTAWAPAPRTCSTLLRFRMPRSSLFGWPTYESICHGHALVGMSLPRWAASVDSSAASQAVGAE